jgi:asparagine synthase (glutamine-hydrolysing)
VAPPFFNSDKLSWMRADGRTLTGAYLVQRGLMEPEQVARVYGCEVGQAQAVFDQVRDTLHEEVRGIADPWSAVSYLETRFYLIPRLLRDADWAGMAHSVELRTPLVDWVLWRRVRSLIAAEQHRKPRSKRELMFAALAPGLVDLIPKAKLGFSNPYRQLAAMAGPDSEAAGEGRAASQQRWAAFVLEKWSGSMATRIA